MTSPPRGSSTRWAAVGMLVLLLVGCGSSQTTTEPRTTPNQTSPWDLPAATPSASGEPATVIRVVDGYTLLVTLEDGGASARVRLLTVRAPELGSHHTDADDQCGAQASADALAQVLEPGGRIVLLALPYEPNRDREGRLLRTVYLPAPTEGAPVSPVNLNVLLVERGWVRHSTDETLDSPVVEGAQARAYALRAGNWGTCWSP